MSTREPSSSPSAVTGTERAIFGQVTASDIRSFLDAYARRHLGSGIAVVRFRTGRIDSVWGVDLYDGRSVVLKVHRLPTDLAARRAARYAQRLLSEASFPCPTPLSGPDEIGGHVVSAETLLHGATPDGRTPANRRLLAAGLAQHIAMLRDHPILIQLGGRPGPSWCRYQAGPWPVPHDTIVDFSSTPSGYAWLDRFGRRAADQILAHRDDHEVVVGHADWYAGNTAVANGALTGTFDWDLIADREAVIAGFAASCYAASSTNGGGLSTPQEVREFMRDYDSVRGAPLSAGEQRVTAGAAAWILAFNARWQVALLEGNHRGDQGLITLVQQQQEAYLSLRW